MLHVALLAVVVTAFAGEDVSGAPAADRKTYEAVRLKAGQDPAALVKLSLWCEAHGLTAERAKHLAEAVGIDPGNVPARGLLGLISYRGKWLSPEDVRIKRNSDEDLAKKLEEYYARRASVEASITALKNDAASRHKAALAHEKLASWCEQQGLKHEATAHFTTAVQYDPYRDAAWKHLGYTKRHGRWMTRDQIAAEEQEVAAQRKADRNWDTLLRKWKADLGENKRRQEAEESLAKVSDPRAVASIVRVFATGGRPADQMRASALLRGIETSQASQELARLAVFSESPEVRESAIETLKKREPRDFVAFLIALIPFPAEYKVQPVNGPGSRGALLVDTPRFTMLRTYDAPPAFTLAESFRGTVTVDSDGMPVVFRGVDLDKMKFMNAQNQLLKMREAKAAHDSVPAGRRLKGCRHAAATGRRRGGDRAVQHAGGRTERARVARSSGGRGSARVEDRPGRPLHLVVRPPRLQL